MSELAQRDLVTVALTPEVAELALAMDRELLANWLRKGDWREWPGWSCAGAMSEIAHHVAKLAAALEAGDPSGIDEHAADVANGALMARWHALKRLGVVMKVGRDG